MILPVITLLLSFPNEKKNEANNSNNKLFKLPLELFEFFIGCEFKIQRSILLCKCNIFFENGVITSNIKMAEKFEMINGVNRFEYCCY